MTLGPRRPPTNHADVTDIVPDKAGEVKQFAVKTGA